MTVKPQLPRSLATVEKAIGTDKTFALLCALGGTHVYVPTKPGTNTLLVQAIGEDAAAKLGRELGGEHLQLPVAGKAVTLWLHSRGMTNFEIARVQRISIKTVGRRLQPAGESPQLDFLSKLAS